MVPPKRFSPMLEDARVNSFIVLIRRLEIVEFKISIRLVAEPVEFSADFIAPS